MSESRFCTLVIECNVSEFFLSVPVWNFDHWKTAYRKKKIVGVKWNDKKDKIGKNKLFVGVKV
jgi:outer membrane receptor for ferric coprogen and ferric-rhodotorulic acid